MAKKFERNKDGKIAAIIEGFLVLVAEKGLTHAKMADLAAATGVSVGTIYRYFPDGVPSILKRLLDHHADDVADFGVFRDLDPQNLKESVRSMVEGHLASHRASITSHLVINQAILAQPDLLKAYREQVEGMLDERASRIREESAYLTRVSPEALRRILGLFFDTLEAFVHRHLLVRPVFPDDDELVAFLTDLLLRSVLESPTSDSSVASSPAAAR